MITKSFTYEQALDYWVGLDSHFSEGWWYAMRRFVEDSGYLKFPASSLRKPREGHCSMNGGLLIHSMNVTRNALALNELWGGTFKKWEVAVAGAFHDIGKLGIMLTSGDMVPRYKQEADESWIYNPDCPKISPTLYSLLITRRFVNLPFYVEEAIAHHDHLYIPENQNRAHNEGALELMLHYADYWACHCQETDAGWKSKRLK